MEYTYDEYRNILNSLTDHGYVFVDYKTEPESKNVILRHDVDISLEKAVKFACLENMWGYKSTYFVLISSDFYNPFSKATFEALQEIIGQW